MRRMIKFIIPLLIVVGLMAGCDESDSSKPSRNETSQSNKSIDGLVSADPAHTMTYSPTRKTINFWIDTWNTPGQLAFTYIRTDNPATSGYYVLDGPPVSMCAALTKTWTYEGTDHDGSDVLDQKVPRRSIDGVYYSGGQCASYYGKDASTGVYIEFSIGAGQNYFLSTQPLPKVSTNALGPTEADMVACGDPGQTDKPVCKVKR
jgi:hypothetical protein